MAEGGSLTPQFFMVANTLLPRLLTLDAAMKKGVQATVLRYEPIAEARMKERAPWTDRTGNARNGLSAKAIFNGDGASLVLFHQVPYGVYLETKNGGKYKVIMPVVQEISQEMQKTISKLFKALGVAGSIG